MEAALTCGNIVSLLLLYDFESRKVDLVNYNAKVDERKPVKIIFQLLSKKSLNIEQKKFKINLSVRI